MVPEALGSLWAEPRPANPAGPLPRDWAVVAGLICWSFGEAVLREDMAPIPLLLLATLASVVPLPWRRTHPLLAVAVAFGTLTVIDIVRVVSGSEGPLPVGVSATLVLTYSLFRWGSGREATYGLILILVWLSMTLVVESTSVAETVGGYAFFSFAATLGAATRYRARVRIRDIEQAKAREREQLARELHDTVAHHVSGIAIQAQAGRAIAGADPERAAEALATIEDAATRTLTELRHMVGVMRAPLDTQFAPQPGLAEVEQLATDGRQSPLVEVVLSGELDNLPPAVGTAVYRLAQESITNARRHARDATRVTVGVAGDSDRIRLTVIDDGAPATGRGTAGYGLIGMRERALLLGGTFHAGPGADRGWRVDASLPRTGTLR
ncbi:sensor histidine kinase [Nostocoides sp. F2B08]|uniref:sensor histidine kinase n=1 Tax=Nostocoides sp. F2B08 TaxID=2653936 RepID=UPI001262C832|nr:sensor histidine kinase [Tetrasphaera sp. F2B08]KAB7744736.1 sensor histidine kinase [Tetrasphaera sp. F2B08]